MITDLRKIIRDLFFLIKYFDKTRS